MASVAPRSMLRQCFLVAGLGGCEQVERVQPLVLDQGLGQLGVALRDVDQVVDHAALGPHHEVEVAQAHVEIDDGDLLAGHRQSGAEGGRRGGFPHPSLAGRYHYNLGHLAAPLVSPES
jgi:hypothetical protein